MGTVMPVACATILYRHPAKASLAGFLTILGSWATSDSLGYNEQKADAQTYDIGGRKTVSAFTGPWLSQGQQLREIRQNFSMPNLSFEKMHALNRFLRTIDLTQKHNCLTSFHIVSLLSGCTLQSRHFPTIRRVQP